MLTQVGLIGWKLEFAIERETKSGSISRGIDVTVVPYHRKPGRRVKFKSWSGGEAQRLRLVGALALSEILLARAGVTPSLQILDEPTRGLAAGGIDDLVNELTVHADRLDRTVLLADHHTIESGAFVATLMVTRQKGGQTEVVSQA